MDQFDKGFLSDMLGIFSAIVFVILIITTLVFGFVKIKKAREEKTEAELLAKIEHIAKQSEEHGHSRR